MVNWSDISYFLSVSRKGTFVAAGTDLKVSHTTVARRISSLEESLQTLLLHRSEKGCILTSAGEKLLGFAEEMESTMISLEESLSGVDRQLTGAIRIGAPDGIGNCYLPSCLTKLRRIHPSLEVELIPVPMYSSLSKREIDILITVRKPVSGNIITRKLTNYHLGLFATKEYLDNHSKITSKEDLKQHEVIGYIDDLLFDEDLAFMEEISPGLLPKFRITTVIAQMNAVAAGAGVGVIPYFMAHGEESLVPILPEHSIARSYWLQVNPDTRRLARVRTTIDYLVEEIELNKELFLGLPKLGQTSYT